MEDLHAHNHSREPEFVGRTYFGQLLRVLVLELPTSPDLHINTPKTLILALIQKLNNVEPQPFANNISSYSDFGALEVVDIATVQAVVGRVHVKDLATGNKRWFIIDRSGPLAQVEYINKDT